MARARSALLIALVSVVLFALLEGLSSLVLTIREASREDPAVVSRYDPVLGWATLPEIAEPERWGPGRGLFTNSQGFRATEPVPVEVEPGTTRALCLGDSFTFGDGVAADDTWCSRLAAARPGLRTVNLGQPGYGLDQVFLRYGSIADSLDHQVVVLGFILDDFARMRVRARNGVAKPVLVPEGDSLRVANTPVPRVWPSVARAIRRFGTNLRVVELAGRAVGGRRAARPAEGAELERLEETVRRVLSALAERSRREGRSLVAVFLPTRADHEATPEWSEILDEMTRELDVAYIDLLEDFRQLDAAAAATLFIPEGAPAGGHYSPAGHEWVSGRILDRGLPNAAPGGS